MAKPHMVICEKCHGDVEATNCIPCEGKGYIVVWETFLTDVTDSGRALIETLHGKPAEMEEAGAQS